MAVDQQDQQGRADLEQRQEAGQPEEAYQHQAVLDTALSCQVGVSLQACSWGVALAFEGGRAGQACLGAYSQEDTCLEAENQQEGIHMACMHQESISTSAGAMQHLVILLYVICSVQE